MGEDGQFRFQICDIKPKLQLLPPLSSGFSKVCLLQNVCFGCCWRYQKQFPFISLQDNFAPLHIHMREMWFGSLSRMLHYFCFQPLNIAVAAVCFCFFYICVAEEGIKISAVTHNKTNGCPCLASSLTGFVLSDWFIKGDESSRAGNNRRSTAMKASDGSQLCF